MKLSVIFCLLPIVDCGVLDAGRNILENALPQQLKKAGDTGECVVSGDGSSCEAAAQEVVVLQSIEYDDQRSLSEASYDVTSPAPIEGDEYGGDMGEAQLIEADNKEDILEVIRQAREYMNSIRNDPKYTKVVGICHNDDSQCAFWASIGECEKNPAYMKIHCAPVCKSCEMKHVETRCPLDPDAKDALYPGDLDKMFMRIITDPYYQQFEPKVLSRPEYAPGDTPETADYKIGIWMIQFEKAATEEEADRLMELGGFLGYDRSSDVGQELDDGTHDKYVNSGRTSTNAWCVDECYDDPLAQRVMQRIQNITGIPETNSENLQLLRYEEGQFYQTHNDYIPYQRERPCGVRILTFYIYLNDVEEGGGTNFPRAVDGGITATPKKGRAVLWPSVFNNHPNTKDSRSDHQALPVRKGVKYGANAWIHQRDFKGANRVGCA